MYNQDENPRINEPKGDLLFHDQPIYLKDNYAGFWLRFAALMIDGIVIVVIIAILSMVFGIGMIDQTDSEEALFYIMSFYGFIQILVILYFSLLESSKWQATLGKRAVGILVTDERGGKISFGRALGRHFAKLLSSIILYIGFIMAGFTERKQALHDLIAGTLIIRDNNKIIQ